MLFIISFIISRDPVGVAASPGYLTQFPATVLRVRLGSSLLGLTAHTALVWHIFFQRSWGIFSNFMTRKVSVLLTRCFFAPFVPLPTPWKILPSSLEQGVLKTSLYVGWRQILIYSSDSPVSLSKNCFAVFYSGLGLHNKLSSFAGYFLFADSTGWTLKVCWVVSYLVRWATGCSAIVSGYNFFFSNWERRGCKIGWWLDGISSVEMVCTLGGGFTLGSGGVPGFAVGTLGAWCFFVDRVRRGR